MTCSLIWQAYADQSPTGRPLRSPAAFPFLVEAHPQAEPRAGVYAKLDARGLLLGILVAYDFPSPFIECAEPNELSATALSATARDLVSALRAPTLEAAILDAAAHLRERPDLEMSHTVLMTGMKLASHSALIRTDFIATSWLLLKRSGEERQLELLRQIATTYRQTDLPLLDPEAIPQTLYAALVAFHLLSGYDQERETLLASSDLLSITDEWYVERIRYLLSEPQPRIEKLV